MYHDKEFLKLRERVGRPSEREIQVDEEEHKSDKERSFKSTERNEMQAEAEKTTRDLRHSDVSCNRRRISLAGNLFEGMELASIAFLAFALPTAAAQPPHLDSYYPDTIRKGAGQYCNTNEVGPYRSTSGVGTQGQGAGVALADINGNGKPDLVLMAYDNPQRGNTFRYKIGWDIDEAGKVTGWTPSYTTVGGVGWEAQGAGLAVGDIDLDGTNDMLVMAYDNPAGNNTFRYRIGWQLNKKGIASNWTPYVSVPGLGNPSSTILGAGAALGDINGNGKLDLVLMATGSSQSYKIGFDLDASGKAASWSGNLTAPRLLSNHQGADVVLADIDLDDKLDIVLATYAYDKTTTFVYRVGWSLQANGSPVEWSRWFRLNGIGDSAEGAGIAHFKSRVAGSMFVFAAYDSSAPGPWNTFRYLMAPLTSSGTAYGYASDAPPKPDNVLSVPTGSGDATGDKLFNLNMTSVQKTAKDAVMTFWFNTLFPGAGDWHDYPDPSGNFAMMFARADADPRFVPDFLVAAVAWYVDQNMGYTTDNINDYVLNTMHGLNYALGGHNIPAHYTIVYTNPYSPVNTDLVKNLNQKDAAWGAEYNDGKSFHGDCEDYAIFRHALLRALGFDRRFIWNMESPSHVQNVVLYRDALRVMDYGPIQRRLCCADTMLFAAWNQDHGPASGKKEWFWDYIVPRIYPDRCRGTGWLLTRRVNPDREWDCSAACK